MINDVQFDEDQVGMPHTVGGHAGPTSFAAANSARQAPTGMSAWLVRHGIMNSDSSAKVLLGIFICINFIAAGCIMYFFVLR
ncbi:MAG: hypothetical protein WCQ60_01100 [bacterium]